ncbi:MAG: hypothetical protein IKY83_06875 [Proteobacteria bacterium]|nr:hypothetical protein [Pseudomonadota bacterium]
MGDIRDYRPPLFALFRQFSKLKSSAAYRQIRASGSERMTLRVSAGRIAHFETHSDICVNALVADKRGGSWRVSSGAFPDFGILSDWEQTTARMAATTSRTDPRPPYHEAKTPPDLLDDTQSLRRYDPEIARGLAAILFHRTYQTLAPILQMGLTADLTAVHRHGAAAWDNAPAIFAWIDNDHFYFDPQTAIEEHLCLYTPEKPHLRRYFSHVTHRLTDRTDASNVIDSLRTAQTLPLLAFSKRNIDRVIFMPNAVTEIFTFLMHAGQTIPLPQDLELVDAPEDGLFERPDMPGDNGKPIASAPLNTAQHAICPILRARSGDMPDAHTPETLSAHIPGHLLCIEHVEINAVSSGNTRIYMPYGGLLCRDGRFLGHVMIPAQTWPLDTLIGWSRPRSTPARIGGFAACALETAL